MVYNKTLYGNLLYSWIFYRNKTCKTILFHLLVQCLFLLLHVESLAVSSIIERVIGCSKWLRIPHGATGKVSETMLLCKFYFWRIFMDRANSHTKSYNIPRSFKAMYINIKYKLKPSAALIYFNDGRDGGGGGVRVIFWVLKFWPKVTFLGLWKTLGFFGLRKKTGIFLGSRKRTKGFFGGMLKKSSDFFG